MSLREVKGLTPMFEPFARVIQIRDLVHEIRPSAADKTWLFTGQKRLHADPIVFAQPGLAL